MMSHHII